MGQKRGPKEPKSLLPVKAAAPTADGDFTGGGSACGTAPAPSKPNHFSFSAMVVFSSLPLMLQSNGIAVVSLPSLACGL